MVISNNWSGLYAQFYDQLFVRDYDEYLFYKNFLSKKLTALELGSGTGTLLVEYVRDGFCVDGLDASQDMLDICAQKLARECNVVCCEPMFYCQNIEQLDLKKTYDIIYAPSCVFMLINKNSALNTLKKIRSVLNTNGQVVISLYNPYQELKHNNFEQYRLWKKLDNKNKTEKLSVYQKILINKKHKKRTSFYRFEIKEHTQEYSFVWHWYSVSEFKKLLIEAGFDEPKLYYDYSFDHDVQKCPKKPKISEFTTAIFVARKIE